MKAPAKRKSETRGDYLSRATGALYAAGTSLPATRKAIALALGETADGTGLLGTVDPIYYRLSGLSSPLPLSGKTAKARATSLAKNAAKRRGEGARWEVLAGSIEAAIGRRVSVREAKALAASGGTDLAASYVGRGTRVGAPATYRAPEAATKESAKTA